jgi:hypothetical protein
MKLSKNLFLLAMALFMSGASLHAEEAAAPGGMDPVAMMKMKALMSPGEAHKVFEAFVGKWNYTGKFWMTPDSPAQDMTGAAEHTLIYGGRFLKQVIEGPWMGEKFEGLGYLGYDNIRKQYVTTWIDSAATGIMTVSGQYDAATKTLTQGGENSCPLTGEVNRKGRSMWTINDADHNTFVSYSVGPDGKEFKVMELVYTRAA